LGFDFLGRFGVGCFVLGFADVVLFWILFCFIAFGFALGLFVDAVYFLRLWLFCLLEQLGVLVVLV